MDERQRQRVKVQDEGGEMLACGVQGRMYVCDLFRVLWAEEMNMDSPGQGLRS